MGARTEAEDRLVAYHEAGHAVAAVRLRLPFVLLTIESGEGSLGHILHDTSSRQLADRRSAGIITPAMRERLMELAICSFAGAAGAGIAEGVDWDWTGAESDEDHVWHCLMLATPDVHHPEGGESPALQALADYCRARTLDLIRGNADRVRAVADALIEHRTLKANRVRAIVKDGDAPPPTDSEREMAQRFRKVAIRNREQDRRQRLIRQLTDLPANELESLIAEARIAAATRSSNTPRRTPRGSEGK